MMYRLDAPPQAVVDFNAVDARGQLRVAIRQLAGFDPIVGGEVQLRDPEGNSCLAVVVRLDSTMLRASVQWETWNSVQALARVVASAPQATLLFEGVWRAVMVGERLVAPALTGGAPA